MKPLIECKATTEMIGFYYKCTGGRTQKYMERDFPAKWEAWSIKHLNEGVPQPINN